MACHMTELSCNNTFAEKEGRKENEEFCFFEFQQFQTLAIIPQVLTFLSIIGSAQEYLVSLLVSKMNPFVRDIDM